ncbi:MAG: hypothetical protein COA47_00690 [Robiginitomaculum sp.]|nr:MAG: hypothetical protein COA47_00690 [Robiginitomaculum sp.]
MTNPKDDLASTRRAIDALDNQMLSLIDQRLALAKSLRALKPAGRAAWDPAREHALLQRLLNRKSDTFPASTLVSMWSALITCSLMTQGPLVLLCRNPEQETLAKLAFPASPTQKLDIKNWRAQTAETPGAIAVLPLPGPDQTWWRELVRPGPALRIQTCLPKWPPNQYGACCVSMGPAVYQEGKINWVVQNQTDELPTDAVVLARSDGLVLFETAQPTAQSDAPGTGLSHKLDQPISIGSFYPPLQIG